MKVKSSRLLAIAVAGTLGAAGNAFATNGSFMIGFGAGSIGMGGVGVTSPQDTMCVGGNPACLAEFERPQFDVGAGLFDPRRRAGTTVMGGGDLRNPDNHPWSGVNTYLMPGMGFVFPFNDELTIGFAALAAGGGGSTYDPNFFGLHIDPNTNTAVRNENYLGAEILQLIVPITVTYRADKTNALGVSIVPARQRFMVQGIQAFAGFSTDPTHMTNTGHDFSNGLGMRLGWTGKYLDNRVTLGATWASKVSMGKLPLYAGTLPNQGSIDIPGNYAIGIGVKATDDLTVALDVQRNEFSDVPAFGNKGPDDQSLNMAACADQAGNGCHPNNLGGPSGPGFSWTDQTVYKLGVAYKNAFPSAFGEKLTLRAGYNYGKMPINPKYLLFSLLAPATTEKHITLGATYSLGDQSIFGFGSEGALTVAYMHAVKAKMEGPTTGTSGGGYASMEMFQNSLDIAYTLKF